MAAYVIPDLSEEKEFWFEILSHLEDNFEVVKDFLTNPEFNYDVFEEIRDCCEDIIEVHRGATKIVFVSSGCDWVLKIPFNSLSKNYCEIECDNYKGACEEGYGKCFAPIYPIGDFENSHCYLMKKVECDGDDSILTSTLREDYSYMSDEEFDDYYDGLDCTELTIEAVAIEYGYDYDEFYNFCGRWEIDDLHNENFGLDNGHIVIIDYSGCNEWY